MCTQFAAAVQGLEGGNCYDDEQLTRPVKRFIADFVRKQVYKKINVFTGNFFQVLDWIKVNVA